MVEGYVPFQSTRPSAPCSFLYPADWQIREIEQDESVEFFIAGPRSPTGTCAASFTVRVSPVSQEMLEDAAAAFLSRYRPAPGFSELGRASGMVAGCPAVEVEITYRMPLPLNSINAQATTIRERHIFLRRGGQLYELLYMALDEDYRTWLEAFRTLVRTFAFLEEPVGATFQPLVTPSSQILREDAIGYENDEGKSSEQSEHDHG
ncbi:MAG: hypothetical protein H5T64_08230 [Chloroflexi bacterium]|nr:hypothetical protein [Chloroflexota bacterium]